MIADKEVVLRRAVEHPRQAAAHDQGAPIGMQLEPEPGAGAGLRHPERREKPAATR